jgi:MGT family glycosyltransferase
MKNARILFVGTPIAACVNPTLPLVAALTRRGHRVTYVITAAFAERVRMHGAEIVEYGRDALSSRTLGDTTYCRFALATLASLDGLKQRRRPDVLIYDHTALAARVLVHRWKLPAVMTSANIALHRSYIQQQIPHPQVRGLVLKESGRADQFLHRYGIENSDFVFRREGLNLFLVPRALEPCERAIDDSCLHAGRIAGEQLGFGSWTPPMEDRPIILVAPSRSYPQTQLYYQACIDAFAGLGWHVVLSIDDADQAAALGSLSSGFEIVQRTSHVKILPHAALIVGMGGTAATGEAAYHGVPWLVTSCGINELEFAADNLMRLGNGMHIRGAHINVNTLRDTARRILGDPAIGQRTRALQWAVRREPGAEECANRIEDYYQQCLAKNSQGYGG